MDMEVLASVFCELLCPECKQNSVKLTEKENLKYGSASCCMLQCDCGYESKFYTSKKSPGRSSGFEVNKRLIYSMRSIGQGHAGVEKFCIYF